MLGAMKRYGARPCRAGRACGRGRAWGRGITRRTRSRAGAAVRRSALSKGLVDHRLERRRVLARGLLSAEQFRRLTLQVGQERVERRRDRQVVDVVEGTGEDARLLDPLV